MSENKNPFFTEDDNDAQSGEVKDENTEKEGEYSSFGSYFMEYQPSDSFEPIKEIPDVEPEAVAELEASQEAAEDDEVPSFYEAEEAVEEPVIESAEAFEEPVELPEEEPLQQEIKDTPVQTEFNPYAPKYGYGEAVNNPAEPSDENLYRYPNQGVNPSYNRPVYTNPYNKQGEFNQQGYYGEPPAGKDGKGKKIAVGVVALCVAVALIALVSSFFGKPGASEVTTTAPVAGYQDQTTATTAAQNVTVATTQPVTQVINSVWVAEKVRPSVVGVMAYSQGELAGEGSGVLMSEDLSKGYTYIVTCAHVINEPGCEFAILLLDGSRYDAEIVALDVRTDIGVLKVNKTGLPLAEFGDSSTLKIGEPIYAIGNPGGSEYFGSITNGIIAAIDRSISATYTMTCIQHNAAINPGNSGGALVNSAGQVIGINSSKIARTDYEGMGFAVPSSIFRTVVDDLIQYGYVPNRPELGIKYAAVSDYQLYSIIVSIKGLPKGSVIIAEIPEGSALSGTGAQVGDLIIAVNGKKMDSSDVLLDLIDTGAVGDTLTLTLCRIKDRSYETSTFDVTVKLVENKGSVTTTTQPQTLPQQDPYGGIEDFFGGFFGW